VRDKIIERLKLGPVTMNGIKKYVGEDVSLEIGKMIGEGIVTTGCLSCGENKHIKVYKLVK